MNTNAVWYNVNSFVRKNQVCLISFFYFCDICKVQLIRQETSVRKNLSIRLGESKAQHGQQRCANLLFVRQVFPWYCQVLETGWMVGLRGWWLTGPTLSGGW